MHLLRAAVTVALIASFAAWWLVETAPEPPSTMAGIVRFEAPSEADVGDRVAVKGTVVVPDASVLDMRLRQCHLESGRCSSIGERGVSGPSIWSGTLGVMRLDEAGSYGLEWTLYADWSPDSRRAAIRRVAEVVVRERAP
jgi:hypothetical protein